MSTDSSKMDGNASVIRFGFEAEMINFFRNGQRLYSSYQNDWPVEKY